MTQVFTGLEEAHGQSVPGFNGKRQDLTVYIIDLSAYALVEPCQQTLHCQSTYLSLAHFSRQ